MSQIFDSIKGLITPDLISKASSFLGEKDSNVTSAVTSMIPTLLGSLLKKGDSPEVQSVLKDASAQNTSIQSQLGNLFSGKSDAATQNIGNNFLTSLLGNKVSDFTSEISKSSGISQGSSSKLLSMIAPLIASFLGSKMSSGNGGGFNLSSILGMLNSEKGGLASMIPAGLSALFGGGDNSNSKDDDDNDIMDKLKGLFS